ncbi:hypothetical protein ABZU76_31550 [Amycolatopsis sp. NPDC005232]
MRTPCTALERMLPAVGDGCGNAAVVSAGHVDTATLQALPDIAVHLPIK